MKMWTEYVVKPFEGKNTGKYRTKQRAFEDAQSRAISEPGETFRVYRARHYDGLCDLIPIISYWFDGKLQYQFENLEKGV